MTPQQMAKAEGRAAVYFQQDWSQIFGGCNWYTFRFCVFEFEWDKMFGSIEFTFIIAGLGLHARWAYTETDAMRDVAKQVSEIDNGRANP